MGDLFHFHFVSQAVEHQHKDSIPQLKYGHLIKDLFLQQVSEEKADVPDGVVFPGAEEELSDHIRGVDENDIQVGKGVVMEVAPAVDNVLEAVNEKIEQVILQSFYNSDVDYLLVKQFIFDIKAF